MVFYAYALDDAFRDANRYLITASSIEVMDQFYRYSRADGMSNLQRRTPEFYTYSYATNFVWHNYQHGKETPNLKGVITFTNMPNWNQADQFMFNNGFVPDHISGNTFYIRSKSNPRVFWNLSRGTVFASKVARTRFRITSHGVSKGEVMIPEDKITIKAIDSETLWESDIYWIENKLVTDGLNAPGGPQAPQRPPGAGHPGHFTGVVSEFTFSDFKKNFLARGKDVEEADAIVSWYGDGGEEWELCN